MTSAIFRSPAGSSSNFWLHSVRHLLMAGAFGIGLAACGGGGGGSSGGNGTSASPAATTISGTVAVGAPMLNATITIKGANGVTKTAAAAADGSYSGIALDGVTAPYAVQACGLVDGVYTCFYSIVYQAGTANVTPLTNASMTLAMGSDPGALFNAGSTSTAPTSTELDAQKLKLKTALADLLAKAGVSDADFVTTPFTADRTGMDKVLDSIKTSTGNDGASNKPFVQIEGIIGSGNAFLDKDSTSGTVTGGNIANVDLRGISSIFVGGMSNAISASSEATCVSRMAAANIFDAAFVLDMDGDTHVTQANAPTMICHFAALENLLGGVFANPVLKDCDFSDLNNKICVVGFNIVNGDASFEGAELAVVLRSGADWKLLGRESVYEVHVGAAIQRNTRVDFPGSAPDYMRAITIDITGEDGVSATGIRAAKVYQRSLDGTAWEATPLATLQLTDACISSVRPGQKSRLAIVNGMATPCDSSWLLMGNNVSNDEGDVLIDNFYRRGRKVKVELFNNVAATGTPVVLIRRVEGVPPKFAALPSYPWLEFDATTKAALASYNGVADTFTLTWLRNSTVAAQDMSFCLGGDCQGPTRAAHIDAIIGRLSATMTLNPKPAGASAFKQIQLYGRNRDQVGVSSNFVSCGGAPVCYGPTP